MNAARTRLKPAFFAASLVALMGGLAGCGAFDSSPPPACPRAAIVDEAKAAPYYRAGKGRDITDIAFEVGILSLSGICEYDESDGRTRLGSVLTIGIAAKRGPASAGESVEVPYFVAVIDPTGHILAKEVFRPRLVFEESGIQAQLIEEVEQIIPIGPLFAGVDYQILVGLQLDRDQLTDNLKRKRR